jgi:hypothetical protein
MSRTPAQPDREAVRPEERAAYDRVVARQTAYRYGTTAGDRAQSYFGALLNSPLIADHMSELGVVYRTRGESEDSYAHADREWVDMVLAHELGWNMVLYLHMPDAVAVGVRPEAIAALREGRNDDLTDDERELASYIRHFVHGTVAPDAYRRLEARIGVRGAVELTAFVGHLLMTIRVMQAIGIPANTDAEVDELLQGILDGTVEIPDPRARVPSLEVEGRLPT